MKIRFRRGSRAQADASTLVLEAGEPSWIIDEHKLVVGDGRRTTRQLLDEGFVLQSGASTSQHELRDTGSPYGALTPPGPGIYYTDTAGTNGAWRWMSTGATDTSWIVVTGDTGWHLLQTWADGDLLGSVAIRRDADTVTLHVEAHGVSDGDAQAQLSVPSGFRWAPPPAPSGDALGQKDVRATLTAHEEAGGLSTIGSIVQSETGDVVIAVTGTSAGTGQLRYTTSDPWPVTLPGTDL